MLMTVLSTILVLSNKVASDKISPRRFRTTPPTDTTHSTAGWQNIKFAKADTSSKSSKSDVAESSSISLTKLSPLYSVSLSYSQSFAFTEEHSVSGKSSKRLKNRDTDQYSSSNEGTRNLTKSSKSAQFVSVESSSKSFKSKATELHDFSNELSLHSSLSFSYSQSHDVSENHSDMAKRFKSTKDRDDHLSAEEETRNSAKPLKSAQFVSVESYPKSAMSEATKPSNDYTEYLTLSRSMSLSHSLPNRASAGHGVGAKSFKSTKDNNGIEQTLDQLSVNEEVRKSANFVKLSSKSSKSEATEPSYISDDLSMPYSISLSHHQLYPTNEGRGVMAKSFKNAKDRNNFEQSSDHSPADEETRKSATPLNSAQFVFIVTPSKSSKSEAIEPRHIFSDDLSMPYSVSLSHSQSFPGSEDRSGMAKSYKSTKDRDSVEQTTEDSSGDEEPRHLAKSSKSSNSVSHEPPSKSSKSQPVAKTSFSNRLSVPNSHSMSHFYLVSNDNGTMAKSSKRFKITKDRSDVAHTTTPSFIGNEYETFSKSSKKLSGPSDFPPKFVFDNLSEMSFSYSKCLSYSQSYMTVQKSGKSSKSYSSVDYSFAGRSKSFKSIESTSSYTSSNDNAMSYDMSYSVYSTSLVPSDQLDSISITSNDVEPESDPEATNGVQRILRSTSFVLISICVAAKVLI